MGVDGVHIEMLQANPTESAKLLAEWFTEVGRTGQFPNEWKEGIICPIYKKGPQNLPENYRLVCLLSHV